MAPNPYFPTARDLPASYFRQALDGLLNLIYPETCFICSASIARQQDRGVCARCWEKTLQLKIKPPLCSSCGLPINNFDMDPGAFLCGKCILQTPPYSGARSFGYYTSELSSLVQELKFHGRRDLADFLGSLLAGTFYDSWSREEFDMVAPIPLHSGRKHERGYNQAELLARSLARYIALPFNAHALTRVRATLPQIGLTDTQRQENVRKAFCCKDPKQVAKQRILLIDDVMTTGATAASASAALLDGGCLRVSVLTVARAVPGL